MRVIDVVEKFGDEAEQFIKKVEDRLAQEKIANGKEEDDLIDIIDQPESTTIILDEQENDSNEIDTLEDIFPDDDSDIDVKIEAVDDLDDIVAELDKEEDDDFPIDDFGDGGLPEL